jgi:peroxiredoxin
MPQLNGLVRDYATQVVFLGIAPDNKDEVKKLLNRFRFDFIIISEAESVFKELGIDGYPKHFFVDKDGIIRQAEEGTPIANKNGKLITENGEWKVLAYENYSKILDALIKNEPEHKK